MSSVTNGDNIDSNLPKEDEEKHDYERFKIVTEEEQNKWALSEGMISYIKEDFERYIPDKDLREGILNENPRSDNFVKWKVT